MTVKSQHLQAIRWPPHSCVTFTRIDVKLCVERKRYCNPNVTLTTAEDGVIAKWSSTVCYGNERYAALTGVRSHFLCVVKWSPICGSRIRLTYAKYFKRNSAFLKRKTDKEISCKTSVEFRKILHMQFQYLSSILL